MSRAKVKVMTFDRYQFKSAVSLCPFHSESVSFAPKKKIRFNSILAGYKKPFVVQVHAFVRRPRAASP